MITVCGNILKDVDLEGETPSLARLISIFLEGPQNKPLHTHLYGKKHAVLNAFVKDAIDLDENYEISSNPHATLGTHASSSRSEGTDKSKLVDLDAIANMAIKKMNKVFKSQPR